MSNAPYDGGHSLRWVPQRTVSLEVNVGDPVASMVTLDAAALGYIRIDYASLVLDYHVSDFNASGTMALYYPTSGFTVPFLAVAGLPITYTAAGIALVSPYAAERVCEQLSNPFIVTDTVNVYLYGHGADGTSSNVGGTISFSAAWPG